MFDVAYQTLVARMFISLGLNDKIVDAIVHEQGYNPPLCTQLFGPKGH